MANKDLIIETALPLKQKNMSLLFCIAQDLTSDIARNLLSLGISRLQATILHNLDHSPKGQLTVNQIKDLIVEDCPNVSRALNKLMDRNLIIKERSRDDQRIVDVLITDEGRAMHMRADALMSKTRIDLSDEDHTVLYNILKKL